MRTRIVPLIIATLTLALAIPGYAQRAGFVTAGIPPVVNSPVQPFVSSPVTPFGVLPAITPPIISTWVSPAHFHPGFGIAGVQPTPGIAVIVPYRVIVPSSVFIPSTTIIAGPGSVIGPGVTVVGPIGPGSVIGPGAFVTAPVAPPVAAGPAVSIPVRGSGHFSAGTPRAQVIEQFGQPSATIVTRDGEMLGFTNGAIIYLQNGLVVIR